MQSALASVHLVPGFFGNLDIQSNEQLQSDPHIMAKDVGQDIVMQFVCSHL